MIERLGELINRGGSVRSVIQAASEDSDDPTELMIRTDETVLRASANPDDDSIDVALCEVQHLPEGLRPLNIEPWPTLIGAEVGWAWAMRNHLGFVDGIQMMFRLTDGQDVCLQINVWASSLKFALFDLFG